MKQLLDFPRAQRLKAYRAAGDMLLRQQGGFSCCALNDALCAEFLGADVCPQFWVTLFGGTDAITGLTVEARDALSRGYYSTLGLMLSDPKAWRQVCADALNTRLMMLAWAHAVDEAGDLEALLEGNP